MLIQTRLSMFSKKNEKLVKYEIYIRLDKDFEKAIPLIIRTIVELINKTIKRDNTTKL